MAFTLFSPAKINLFLRIVGKRSDGYHELSSLFQTIDLGDHLQFQVSEEDRLICSNPHVPIDPSNLILKTTHLFRQKTGIPLHLHIHLDKRIPIQAGLGGGSSNAATTLWACRQLTDLSIPIDQLAKWGAEIGSDVPFFFSQGTAHCRGKGEVVHPLASLPATSLWIIKPIIGLSTPEVYQKVQIESIQKEMNDERLLKNFLFNSPLYINDLEKAAFKVQPELEKLKASLYACGFTTVVMAGSGSAFFCLGKGQPPNYLFSFQARFIRRHFLNWYA
jgi:4-diphosphocytidyl-2-C-methyl-D-erythritol kinase